MRESLANKIGREKCLLFFFLECDVGFAWEFVNTIERESWIQREGV